MPDPQSDPSLNGSLDAIRASKRKWAAKKKAELDSLTRLEQLAYRLRGSLGEGFDPYTQPERKRVEKLRASLDAIQREADMLHQEIAARLSRDGERDPARAKLAAALEMEKAVRLEIRPF